MYKCMTNGFRKAVFAVGGVASLLFTVVIAIVCSHQGVHYFQYDIVEPIPNWLCIIIGLGILLAFSLVVYYFLHSKHDKQLNCNKLMIAASFTMFVVQIFLLWNYYVKTGWDVATLLNAAERLASTGTVGNSIGYFSVYPNNMLLTVCMAVFIKIFNVAGLSEHWYFGMICLLCLLSQITAYLLYKISRYITNGRWAGVLSWLLFNIIIGLSPWLSIPYSDTFALIFPILILYLYTLNGSKRYKYLKWFFIGVLTVVGYSIKPQVAIVLIAIIITCACRFVFSIKLATLIKLLRPISLKIAILLFGCITSVVFVNLATLPIKNDSGYNEDNAVGLTHYVMLGMSAKCQGQYCSELSDFTASFKDPDSRSAGNIQKTKEELLEMGWSGFLRLMYNKALANYTDGTFGWAKEGGSWTVHEPDVFFMENNIDRNTGLSDVLHRIYISNGKDSFQVAMQSIWLGMLTISIFIIIGIKKILDSRNFAAGNKLDRKKRLSDAADRANIIMVVLMSIFGIALFEQLFEARARYLIIYVPFFIIIATVSVWGMFSKLRELINIRSLKKNLKR